MAKDKKLKTNAMRILDSKKVSYEMLSYVYVFVIPVAEELDLKNAAKIAGEKKVEMIAVKDIMKYTGYIRGGCSPIGMKKNYKTFIHESAEDLDFIIFSAGKIGHQIKMNPKDLVSVVEGKFAFLIK
ncbi:MAG: aminoacyl-tRNA deacylase [Clostridium perfringens]|nr:aminoacyl-tRNA deacylase [Clostridium perfringens]